MQPSLVGCPPAASHWSSHPGVRFSVEGIGPPKAVTVRKSKAISDLRIPGMFGDLSNLLRLAG